MPTLETKTIKPSGGDFSGIQDFKNNYAGGKDLVSRDVQLDVACYAFEDSTFSTDFDLTGWTTDSTRYLRFYTPSTERHNGTLRSGYRMKAYNGLSIFFNCPYIRLEGIALNLLGGIDMFKAFWFNSAVDYGNVIIRECLIACEDGSGFVYAGMGIENATAGNFYLINNIIFTLDTTLTEVGSAVWAKTGSGYTVYAYNNTLYNWSRALSFQHAMMRDAGTFVAKNNIVDCPGLHAGAKCYGGTFDAASTNNLSSDATAPGANAQQNVSPTYVSSSDFHLASSDTAAKDKGIDLSADANFPFSVDIDGRTRPQGTLWDIGAHEVFVNPTSMFFGAR